MVGDGAAAFNGTDGAGPIGAIIFDHNGNAYGTAFDGGLGYGTVYELAPSGGGWTETVLYTFGQFPGDGQFLYAGVIFDNAGSLYGVTTEGGTNGFGTVFQLVPSGSGWTENILYSFTNGTDGNFPAGGLIFDQSGNLYGTTAYGGAYGKGTVFELSQSGATWTLTTLHSFAGVGPGSWGSLVMDANGNLFGTTLGDGIYGWGSIFKLTPSGQNWTYSDLYDFTGGNDGADIWSGLTPDSNGNFYGTSAGGGTYGWGTVFEFTP